MSKVYSLQQPEHELRDHHLPNTKCPNCEAEIDAALDTTSDDPPRPGDFVVCIECATVNKFGKGFTIESTTGAELAALGEEDPIALAALFRAVRAVQHLIKERHERN